MNRIIKKYISDQGMVYTKAIQEMFKPFTEKERKFCSLSTFLKYKPFYITNPN